MVCQLRIDEAITLKNDFEQLAGLTSKQFLRREAWQRYRYGLNGYALTKQDGQMPIISPSSDRSIRCAAGSCGNPGMVTMSPVITSR